MAVMLCFGDPVSDWEPGSEFSVMGEMAAVMLVWLKTSWSEVLDLLPPSVSEKNPLESISVLRSSDMAMEEMMEDGILPDMLPLTTMLEMPVSWVVKLCKKVKKVLTFANFEL